MNLLGEPLWRISRVDLDRLMGTVDVASARMSKCAFAAGSRVKVDRVNQPTIFYGLTGSGTIAIEGEAQIDLTPHVLVVVPAHRQVEIAAPGYGRFVSGTGISGKPNFVPGLSPRYAVGEGGASFSFVGGSFQATYGPELDLFASLAAPVVERFDAYDQLDQLMNYAMAEIAGREIGGGPIASALFKLVLLALLRRSLTSTNAWVERLSILSDPPIARAYAEMASRPSVEFTVQSLCRSVGLSRSAFMARFTAAFGDSPMSVLRRLRMRHAAGLLAANALSIEQVAIHSGYQSRSSFTRTFRKHYGADPSEFRACAKVAFLEDTDLACNDDRRHGVIVA